MSRALLGAVLLLSGCTLLVSLDDLSGGASLKEEPEAEGGASKAKAADAKASDAADAGADTNSAYAREVLADAPSIYLRFGEAPGAKAVKNELGALEATYPTEITLGVKGALAGEPDTAVGFHGGAIELPPGQDCEGTSPCVLELWFMIDEIQDGYGWMVDHQRWDPREGWMLQTQDGYVTFERWAEDHGVGAAYNQVKIELHEWHHLAAIADREGQRVYYDGELREHHALLNPIPATKGKWTVGATACFDCGSRSYYQGAIDELAVYEHPLSEERIKAHYAVGRGR